jgi:hypothetical protein
VGIYEDDGVSTLLATLTAIESNPSEENRVAAAEAVSAVSRMLVSSSRPDSAALAAVQVLRGWLEALAGEELASVTAEVAVRLAEEISDANEGDRILVAALLSAARSHSRGGRPGIARLRAAEALAVAQVRLGSTHPATTASWKELGRVCEELLDLTAARAAYRGAKASSR